MWQWERRQFLEQKGRERRGGAGQGMEGRAWDV